MKHIVNPFYNDEFRESFKLKWKEKKQITNVYDYLDKVSSTKTEIIPYNETYLDRQAFVKEYKSSYKELKYRLSYTALRIYEYIKDNLEIGNDYVKLDYEDIMFQFEWKSIRSVYAGLKELISKGFISDSPELKKYWININIFFNGDRVTKFKEIYLKPKTIIKDGVRMTLYEQRRQIVIEENNASNSSI